MTEGLITAGEGLPWESAELGQAHSLQFAHLQAVGKLNAAASRILSLKGPSGPRGEGSSPGLGFWSSPEPLWRVGGVGMQRRPSNRLGRPLHPWVGR